MTDIYNLNMKVDPNPDSPDVEYSLIGGESDLVGTVVCGEDVRQFNLVYTKEDKVYRCQNDDMGKARPDGMTLQSAKKGEVCPILIVGQLYCDAFDLPMGVTLWVGKNPGCIEATAVTTLDPETCYVGVGGTVGKQEIYIQVPNFSSFGDLIWEMKYQIKHLWTCSVLPGDHFLHYKAPKDDERSLDGVYGALGVAKHTETGELLVFYIGEKDGKLWARPEKMFIEEVSEGVRRFEPLEFEEDDDYVG